MNQIKTLVATITGLALTAASSQAALTTVQDLWGTGAPGNTEWNINNSGVGPAVGSGIMEYIYGTGNFTRVDDAGDKFWAGGPGAISFQAIYAGNSQALYTSGLGGTSESAAILTASGSTGTTPTRAGGIATFTPAAQPFLFLDKSGSTFAYSDPAYASGLVDRMVTFKVTGYYADPVNHTGWTAFTDAHYVIGFEDGTDFDFNDLVVEVSGVSPETGLGATPVPEPSTVIAAALLLLPFGASTIRILRKNRMGQA